MPVRARAGRITDTRSIRWLLSIRESVPLARIPSPESGREITRPGNRSAVSHPSALGTGCSGFQGGAVAAARSSEGAGLVAGASLGDDGGCAGSAHDVIG